VALVVVEEPNCDTQVNVRAVAEGCGTNSQPPGSDRDEKIPKPADLSVLGLQPHNHLTPTGPLSTRMHYPPATALRPARSLSRFRQITTSPGRLLAFIRPARATPFHPLLRSVSETGSAMAGLTSVELA